MTGRSNGNYYNRSGGVHSAQGIFGRPRASSSETNLRKLALSGGGGGNSFGGAAGAMAASGAAFDMLQNRPGSALGLLQGEKLAFWSKLPPLTIPFKIIFSFLRRQQQRTNECDEGTREANSREYFAAGFAPSRSGRISGDNTGEQNALNSFRKCLIILNMF